MITSVGQRLGERYVLRERIAVGGMGEVWAAVDEVLNRPVAVKVLRTDLAPDANFQARFRAEARTAAALSHGGIAAVYDYGEALGSAYLVMELVPGDPLSALIADEGALGTERTLSIVSQAARALHAAHRHGVIHRDIKPANLMVTPEMRVKVTDFGIARPRDHEPLTATGQVMGTAHYLAPELARGETASPLSDVYALGVVAYECLTGWRPFEGDNQVAVATAHLQDEPPPLPETIPAPVRQIVMSAMAKNPAKRPQGANALASLMEDARLRGLAGGRPSGELPVPPRDPESWPTSADTQAHGQSGRRNAAIDRADGRPSGPSGSQARPSAWESRSQRREQESQPPADPGSDYGYRRDVSREQPQQGGYRQPEQYFESGGYDDGRGGHDDRYDDPRRPGTGPRAAFAGGEPGYDQGYDQGYEPGYDRQGQPDRQERYDRRDDDPFSSLGSGGDYPSRSSMRGTARSRAGHNRGGQPATGGSSSGRGNRRLSMPLIALIALVVLVAIVFAATRGHAATRSQGTSGLRSDHVSSSMFAGSNASMVTGVGIRG
ncbi:protein kinase domain-containing protein [Kineosporia succinea]|uniref:non-specific serine/threonine protein kinase n=1 Tax=Kineosporia succinea TaxID=84632 RepID=A0ABT9P0V5_9ACTN|nr:protein kinase [Kineosporia succinea]MDP9826308.1 serine/threonine-protein kinase [Kineosporia succinea]